LNVRFRIVVANQAMARFYDTLGYGRPLSPAGDLQNPAARRHERDFDSDRPGRVFDSASPAGRRRGASAHHATNGEYSTRRREIERFAQRVAAKLARESAALRFDRLVLIAAPAFLGMLRDALPAALRAQVAATVNRDIAQLGEADVRDHLTAAMFRSAAGFSPAKRATARSLP
jgi:protein required for attachment to host cells